MEGWLNHIARFLDLWMIRIAVLSSFAAHLVLILLAGIRRHKASGGRMLLLWLAYQLGNWAATYALGNLSFGCKSQEQQQLVAFWAPFLLQHLGGPDNISAYSLEDNVLSGRQALNVFVQVGGAVYVVYKHIYMGAGDGVLLPASIIILSVGVAKYVEKALALRRGNLSNIRSSSKKKKKQPISRFADASAFRRGRVKDEQALMVAHNMFPFCQRAMTDSSVDMDSPDLDTSRKIFSFGWENMCKVVEMELSLMYDILYTKAAMVHTWGGYLIRLVSPLATITAFFLFLICSKDGQRREDVIITYTLLAATFLLDMRWLFRAVGSTWAHAFLQARPLCWLHHKALSSRRWYRLRRVVVSLDIGRLVLLMAPSRYRTWSGTIGQYSLLDVCTRDTTLCGRAAKKIGLEEGWKEHHHSQGRELSEDVKGLVFERVRKILSSTYEGKVEDAAYSMNDITTFWGQAAAKRRPKKKLKRFVLAFGREFQEDILVWHIATQVFLTCASDQSLIHGENAAATHAKAIRALSEYLMFLVAVRRHMLPGLVLRSLYEVTRDALQDIWRVEADTSSSSTTGRGEKLARILRDKKDANSEWGLEHDKTRLVSDGANIAMVLLGADQSEMPELLELVFNVWVDKLLYAGTRCSRESHARQLSRGGELTTIVWILAEHAGPFQIGQRGPDHKKSGDKKKAEEKKPDQYPPYMYPPLPPPPPPFGGLPTFPPMPVFGGPPVDLPIPPPPPRPLPVDIKPTEGTRARRRYATLYPVD